MECRSCGWAQDEAAPACPRCGSDAVTSTPLWERPAPISGWGQHPPAAGPAPGPVAAAPPGPRRAGAGRRGLAVLLVGLGVVAALTVGALAVLALRGGGGASSPEGAVRRLARAIDAEDPVAVAAALAPEEVGGLADVLAQAEDRVGELGLGPDDDPLAGVDLTVDRLGLQTEELGDDVAKVTALSGRLGWSLDPDVVGATGSALAGGETSGSVAADELSAPYLLTVQRDGGWYVSLTYTVAEHVVDELGLAGPDFDGPDGDPRRAADTPEDAVRELIEAVGSVDVADAAAVLPAGEWGALLPYQDAVEELFGPDEGGGDVAVTDLDATVHELDGGAMRVEVVGARGTYRDGFGQEAGWTASGWCVTADGFDGSSEPVCPLDPDTYVGRALTPTASPSVVVLPERGGWVVSPLRTVLGHVAAVLPDLDVDVLVTLLGRPDLVPTSGEAPFGTVEQVPLGPAGVTTWTFTPERDLELVASADPDASIAVVGTASGGGAHFGGRSGIAVVAGETYTVVISREERRGDAPVSVNLGAVERRDLGEVALAGTIDEALTAAGPVHRTTFTVDRARRARLDVGGAGAGDAAVSLASDDGRVCGAEDRCSFVPGTTYTLTTEAVGVVAEDGLEVSVGFADQAAAPEGDGDEATVDGETSVSGLLVDETDRAVHSLVVPDGLTVVVTIRADEPDVDVDAEVDGETYQAVGDEVLTLDGPLLADIEVYVYDVGSTGYEITVAPA